MRIGAHFCPGILHAVPAKDGLLLRIRVPGGLLDADQLRTVADLAGDFADGTVEITSRANLQLRAIHDRDLEKVVGSLASAGLLPSPQHDRVRNIVTSPLAGLDAEETMDTRPLVRELDRRLRAETVFAELHPKFSFALYSGGRRFSHEGDDLCLEAMDAMEAMDGNADSSLRLSIGGLASGFAVAAGDAVECLLEAARVCIRLAKESGLPVRGKRVIALGGAIGQITHSLSHVLTPCSPPLRSPSFVEPPLGIYPTLQPGRVSIIPSVPLGRLTVEQAQSLAHAAAEWKGDLRLAPWRGVVLASIPDGEAANIVQRLHSIGLPCDGRDGYRGIASCAGSTGCDASLADVRRDAASLARILAGRAAPSGWTVNLSGCDKQCARRGGATAELIAEASGYTLKIKGQPVASSCSPEFAIHAVANLHNEILSEGACK